MKIEVYNNSEEAGRRAAGLTAKLLNEAITKKGLKLTKCAKRLLSETIETITSGERFNGLKTIKKLGEDIAFDMNNDILAGKKLISADMLSSFDKNSLYVQHTISNNGVDSIKQIGFSSKKEDSYNEQR